MGLEIIPLGGFLEVGRNCTLVKVDDEAIILDMGLHMDNYITYTDDEDRDDLDEKKDMSGDALIKVNAVPNLYEVQDLWPKVKAICIGHAHLDHIGAVPFLASKFTNASIHGTRYTMEVLKEMLRGEGTKLKNKIVSHEPNGQAKISDKITVEFVNMTHSTPQSALMVIHTPYGKVAYALDFKLDNAPVLGEKPNYKRLEELGKQGIKVLIFECLYVHMNTKTPSESIAREMLKDVMLGVNSKGNSIVVTTFSSHIARLKSIVDMGKLLKRRVVLVGRSFDKYVMAAKRANVIDLTKNVEMVKYGGMAGKYFKKVRNPENQIFVVTGHQAEHGSILPRMVFDKMYNFKEQDNVIFSCTVIPVENNIRNRDKLEDELRRRKIRIFKDVHSSGHAYREDQRELIRIMKPEFLMPAHADEPKVLLARELAVEMGYSPEDVLIAKNGDRIEF